MDQGSEDYLSMLGLMIGIDNTRELRDIVTKSALTAKIDTYKYQSFLVRVMYEILMWFIRKQRQAGIKLVWK